jgi:hypothetical protein
MKPASAYAKQMTLCTGFDSDKELRRGDMQDSRRRKPSRPDRPPPGIVTIGPSTAAPTSEQRKTNAKALEHAGIQSDYQSHCRDQTITHRHPKGGKRCQRNARRPTQPGLGFHPKSLPRGKGQSKKTPQRRLQQENDALRRRHRWPAIAGLNFRPELLDLHLTQPAGASPRHH